MPTPTQDVPDRGFDREASQEYMNAKAILIDWMLDWGNSPRIKVLVDNIPPFEEIPHKEYSDGLFVGEKDGYVTMWSGGHKGENAGGLSGSHVTITMEDGEQKTLKGPWIGNSSASKDFEDMPRFLEVSITDDPKVIEKGHTFTSAWVTLDWINQYWDEMVNPRDPEKRSDLQTQIVLKENNIGVLVATYVNKRLDPDEVEAGNKPNLYSAVKLRCSFAKGLKRHIRGKKSKLNRRENRLERLKNSQMNELNNTGRIKAQ